MQRRARHFPGGAAGSAKLAQQLLRLLDGGGGRSVQPIERTEIGIHGLQEQRRGGQVFAQNLRHVLRRPADEILLRVEANGASGAGASRAPGALIGAGLADARHLKRGQPGPGRVAGHARQAAIDHRADAIDGDGAFRHVGREDDLGLGARRDGAVLLFGRLVAVERQELPAVTAGQRRTGGLRAADFERRPAGRPGHVR